MDHYTINLTVNGVGAGKSYTPGSVHEWIQTCCEVQEPHTRRDRSADEQTELDTLVASKLRRCCAVCALVILYPALRSRDSD
jgi:hypothetical protein